MYLQITNRCNMRCSHCLFDCTEQGTDMSFDIARQAIDIASNYEEYITIGGGEPTLHPKFIEIAAYTSFISCEEMQPFLVTNGTCSEKVWNMLMKAKRLNNIDVRVSRDPWHDEDMIKLWVWRDAEKERLWWGFPGDDRTRGLECKGRAVKNWDEILTEAHDWYERVKTDGCNDEIRVDPHGMVWVDAERECYRIGSLSETTFEKALDFIDQKREERFREKWMN